MKNNFRMDKHGGITAKDGKVFGMIVGDINSDNLMTMIERAYELGRFDQLKESIANAEKLMEEFGV